MTFELFVRRSRRPRTVTPHVQSEFALDYRCNTGKVGERIRLRDRIINGAVAAATGSQR